MVHATFMPDAIPQLNKHRHVLPAGWPFYAWLIGLATGSACALIFLLLVQQWAAGTPRCMDSLHHDQGAEGSQGTPQTPTGIDSISSSGTSPPPHTFESINLSAVPGGCTIAGTARLAAIIVAGAYNVARMVPTCQRVLQTWRPHAYLHRSRWPLWMAVGAAIVVYGAQASAAGAVLESTHWPVTQVSATVLSAILCNAMAEWVDLGLALEWSLP